jgi:HEPN domain-containing protein
MKSLPLTNEQFRDKIVAVTRPKAIFWSSGLWVIIIPDNPLFKLDETARLLNPLFHAYRGFKFCVYTYSQIANEIKKGNIFISTACLTEDLVYDPENISVPSPEPTKITEILSYAITQFDFGVGRSGSLKEGAAFYFAKQELSLSMFMLHQATELLQRGLLLSLTNQNLRSHSINEFNDKIRKCIPKLVFLEDDASEEKYLIEQLEYAYSSARYNIAYEVSEERIWQLFGKLRTYTNAAIQTFNEKVSCFKNAYPINE